MAKVIRCECGFVARGTTDDDVVAMIRSHLSANHPALVDKVTDDDLLGWIEVE